MAIKRPLARFNGHDGKIPFYRTLQEVILFEIYSVRTSADMADQTNLAERVKDVRLYSFIPLGRGNVLILRVSHELGINLHLSPCLQGLFDYPCLHRSSPSKLWTEWLHGRFDEMIFYHHAH